MSMGSHASQEEPAQHTDASSEDPGYAAAENDRPVAQEQQEGTTQQNPVTQEQDVEADRIAHEQRYLESEQEGLQQSDTAGAQQPREAATQHEAALRLQAMAEVEHSIDETDALARVESGAASGMQQQF